MCVIFWLERLNLHSILRFMSDDIYNLRRCMYNSLGSVYAIMQFQRYRSQLRTYLLSTNDISSSSCWMQSSACICVIF